MGWGSLHWHALDAFASVLLPAYQNEKPGKRKSRMRQTLFAIWRCA
jgi:hypothetical protein